MPPLPTTNLSGHWDASVNTDLYDTLTGGGVFTGNPADGGAILAWDDQVDVATDSSQVTIGLLSGSTSAEWHDDTALKLPSVKILAEHLRAEHKSGVGIGRTTFMPNTGKTMLLSFYLDSAASTIPNHASVFQNCVLAGEPRNNFFGLFIKQPSVGVYELHAYTWDGASKSVSLSLTPDAPHTVCVVHDGTNLTLSMDCGTPVSVAAGNTTNSAGALQFGDTGSNGTTTAEFRGRIGEVALYSAALTGSDLSDAKAYFCSKWLTISGITILGSAVFGSKGTVTTSRTFLANLDDTTRSVAAEKSLAVGGNVMLIEQASAPAGISNAALLFTEDNGAGKTRLMVQFGSGSAIQLAIEP